MVFPFLIPLLGFGAVWLYNWFRPRYYNYVEPLYYYHPYTQRVVWVPVSQRNIFPKETVEIQYH